jgi:hypothetical protein
MSHRRPLSFAATGLMMAAGLLAGCTPPAPAQPPAPPPAFSEARRPS